MSVLVFVGFCFSAASVANAWQVEPPIEPPVEPGICSPDCIFEDISCGVAFTADFPKSECQLERGSPVDFYTLEVPEGSEQVTIDLTAAYDTYLALYDADCNLIQLNDDGGLGLNSRINQELVPGTYLVGASSYSVTGAGDFTLVANCREPFDQAALCNDCVISEAECGAETTGTYPESGCPRETGEEIDLYMIDLPPEGGRLILTLQSPDFAPYIEVYDENCLTLGAAQAVGDTARLSVESFGGLTFVGVSSTAIGSAGGFTLTVECREALAPENVCPECQVGEISCGESTEGVFPQTGCLRPNSNGQEIDIYQIEIEERQEVTIDLSSTDAQLDTWIELYDADCNRVAFNDDGGVGLNSLLIQNLDPGTYFIGVSSYAATDTGPYLLSTSCREPFELCGGDCEVALMSCGIPEEGIFPMTECRRLSGQMLDLYSIVIAGGDLTVDLTGDYDTYMQLYDENCQLLAQDDDGGDGLNSRLIMMDLPGGIYYVGVSSYATGQAGGFTINAVCESGDNFCVRCRVDTIAPEQTLTGVLGASECTLPPFDQPIEVYAFRIDEFFDGRISVSSDSFDPTVALFNDLCDEVSFNDNCGAGTEAACLNVSLEAGTYSIVVSSEDAGAVGEFAVSVMANTEDGVFSRGDSNGDGSLELTDAVVILNYLFTGGVSPACLEAADADNDAQINLTDGVLILSYLFQGGNAPALPGPPGLNTGCGPDIDIPGSDGDLGCDNYSGCN